jgi:hypothetical protein
MNGVVTVQDAPNPDELAHRLQRLFAPIAPTVQVYLEENGAPEPAPRMPDSSESLQVIMWEHHGVATDYSQRRYTSERVDHRLRGGQIPPSFRAPERVHRADLGRGVSAQIPVALYADDAGALPEPSSESDPLKPADEYRPETRYLAGQIRAHL